MLELLIQAGGIYSLGFVIFHLLFWRIFDWDRDLRSLSFLNRAIMQVVNLSLTFVFAIFGAISLLHTRELLETPLGHSLTLLIAMFWLFRAILQPLFFKLKHWSSVVFLAVFLLGSLLYGIPAILGM